MKDQFYKDFLEIFEPYFQEILATIQSQTLGDFPADTRKSFFSPLTSLTQEGKRTRPFLLALGADSLSERVLSAGAAYELFHLFALVHDDIMDGADMRRNVPTAHKQYEKQNLPGSASAILLGDYLLTQATEIMAKNNPSLLTDFLFIQKFVTLGQFYEISHWGETVDPQVSRKIALFKSSDYSVKYPLQLGLKLLEKNTDILNTYAYNIGLAFQMRDDWLDITGTQSGKDTETDSKNEVPNIVQGMLTKNNFDKEKTKDEVQKELDIYFTSAIASLSLLSISERQQSSLMSLAEFYTKIS